MIKGNILWVGLTVLVAVYSFGGVILLIVGPFAVGALLIVSYLSYYEVHHGNPAGQETMEMCTGLIQGDIRVFKKRQKVDQRLTGAKLVDEQLQKLVTYGVRDFVESWYYGHISNDPHFIELVRECASSVLINFASRSKTVEWLPFCTQRVIDDFVSHLRIFRKALKNCQETDPKKVTDLLEDAFFVEEAKTDNQLRFKEICSSVENEKAYLQSIAEMLLYLLLPEDDFQNKALCFILREVLVEQILLPLANLLSDPDYFNGTVVMLCRESSLNPESFIAAINTCDVSSELSTIAGCILQEIERTKQHGSSEEHLEQLGSLNYVAKLCHTHSTSQDQQTLDNELAELGNVSLPVVSLRSILTNDKALSYLIDFFSGDPVKQAHVSFWIEAETFNMMMNQLVDKYANDEENMAETLKRYAANAKDIFENHFSEEAFPRLVLSEETFDQTQKALETEPLLPDCLVNAQDEIFHVLEGQDYYDAFLKSRPYKMCLTSLGMLSDTAQVSMEQSMTVSEQKAKLMKLKAHIPTYVEKREGKKPSYTCYRIQVTCQHQMGPEETFFVERRYSDFHTFHLQLKAKLKILPPSLTLPIPWSLNKHDPALKESRRKGLDVYLQVLLSDDKINKNPQSFEMIIIFLSDSYVRENQFLNRKMDSITRPFRDLRLRSTGNSPGLIRKMLHLPVTPVAEEQSALLSAGLDEQDEENIPLQVMLRLMDEVFELRLKSQGLRRHVTRLLKQFIRATFGDRINRQIVQHIDWMTSPQQIAQQIGMLCDSMWPEGCRAPPSPERSETTKHITRVIARAKLLGSMPDDLRRFIGTKNSQEGTTQVLELFQYQRLNKRIVYVLFEGLLEAIFAQHNISSVLQKLH
ncbi:sorting nexin-13-like [Dysidea avara]|uniref:sorting nexin-13-like n=1 Tax=Dysidea avara TaxID=196820 RepID=UPI003325AD66